MGITRLFLLLFLFSPFPSSPFFLIAQVLHSAKQLRLYEGLYHDLFHEPEKEEVTADLIGWLNDRCPTKVATPGVTSGTQ